MLSMARRDPVLTELQVQPEPESGLQRCHWRCTEHQAGHAHGHGHKTQLRGLALFNEGARYHPADTNALPDSHLLTKVSSGEWRAFPSMFREWAASLQHREQDQTRSLAGPITSLRTPSPAPGDGDGEDIALAQRAPTGNRGGGGTSSSIAPSWDFKGYRYRETYSAPKIISTKNPKPKEMYREIPSLLKPTATCLSRGPEIYLLVMEGKKLLKFDSAGAIQINI